MKTHNLCDPQTDNICTIKLSDKKVIVETGKMGKSKTSEKEYSDHEEASKHFEKKEWEMLKKGYVLRNQDGKAGQPCLHYFVGGGNTGCLSISNLEENAAVYQAQNQNSDLIQVIDRNGILKETIELPAILPWDMLFHQTHKFLLLDIDHLIYTYSVARKEFTKLTSSFDQPGSFVSLCNSRMAYGSAPAVVVQDINSDKRIFERNFTPELYSGHSHQFQGAISKNGKLLAICIHSGQLIIIDLDSGKEIIINGSFEMIVQMEFANNDTLLVIKEQYGTWGVRYFDLVTTTEIEFPTLNAFSHSKEVDSFCFNEDQSKLVMVKRTNAYIFDFSNKQLLHTFKIDHCVKNAKPKFIGELLGFRTDYGCFSLYKV